MESASPGDGFAKKQQGTADVPGTPPTAVAAVAPAAKVRVALARSAKLERRFLHLELLHAVPLCGPVPARTSIDVLA